MRSVGSGSSVEKWRRTHSTPSSTHWATNPQNRFDHRWVRHTALQASSWRKMQAERRRPRRRSLSEVWPTEEEVRVFVLLLDSPLALCPRSPNDGRSLCHGAHHQAPRPRRNPRLGCSGDHRQHIPTIIDVDPQVWRQRHAGVRPVVALAYQLEPGQVAGPRAELPAADSDVLDREGHDDRRARLQQGQYDRAAR